MVGQWYSVALGWAKLNVEAPPNCEALVPEYGEGQLAACIFHWSGVRPLHICTVLAAALLADAPADWLWQAVAPSTGREAIVMTTGALASPARSKRRRASDFGVSGDFRLSSGKPFLTSMPRC